MDTNLFHKSLITSLKMFGRGEAHALLVYGASKEEQLNVLNHAANMCGVRSYGISYAGDGEKPATIEDIRNIKSTFRLKSSTEDPKAAVILNANNMAVPAQNAFLKLLEEPPENTFLLLGASSRRGILPTIQSRVVDVRYTKPAVGDVVQHFIGSHTEKDIKTAYLLAKGEPSRIALILQGSGQDKVAVEAAKEVLKKTLFERIMLVDEFQKDKEKKKLPQVIQGLITIYSTGLKNAAETGKPLDKWEKGLRSALFAEEALSNNASARLVALKLMSDL